MALTTFPSKNKIQAELWRAFDLANPDLYEKRHSDPIYGDTARKKSTIELFADHFANKRVGDSEILYNMVRLEGKIVKPHEELSATTQTQNIILKSIQILKKDPSFLNAPQSCIYSFYTCTINPLTEVWEIKSLSQNPSIEQILGDSGSAPEAASTSPMLEDRVVTNLTYCVNDLLLRKVQSVFQRTILAQQEQVVDEEEKDEDIYS